MQALRGESSGGNSIWAKEDLPLEARILRSVTMGAKHAMVDWGWPEKTLWADPAAGTLKLAGEIVLSASIHEQQLNVEYGKNWKPYLTSAAFPQVLNLVKANTEKFSAKGKGKDKGAKGALFKGTHDTAGASDPWTANDPWYQAAGKGPGQNW